MTMAATPTAFGVDDLDAVAVLACLGQAETAERRGALVKLELALHWCVLHPATVDTGAAVWGDAGLPGLSECDEALGGEGCPRVSAFAPEPFAAALGVPTTIGMQLLADARHLHLARPPRHDVPSHTARHRGPRAPDILLTRAPMV